MRQRNCWWLLLMVILPLGCGTSGQSSKPSPTENDRFMDMWNIYTHCSKSEDLDAMRVDAQRLSHAVDVTPNPKPRESEEAASLRLSADPAAMAAACALRAGQVAQDMGRLSFAREMFQMIVTNFPQPRYGYYAEQAREGLERLDGSTSGWLQEQTAA